MREKELSICIGIHHIATFWGITEGIYYLLARRQRFLRSSMIFLLTVFQSWAGIKILADLRDGRSRLKESYTSLQKIKGGRGGTRGLLWGAALSSALFKVLLVRLLGRK